MIKRIITGGLILVLIIATILAYIFWPNPIQDTPQEDAPQEETAQIDQMEEDLSFTLDKRLFDDYSWEFIDYQMSTQDRAVTKATGFSNAVSFPFGDMDKEGMQEELYDEILRSPVFADMVARALVDVKITDQKTLGQLNPWMGEFISKMDEAMKRGESPRGNEVWLCRHSGEGETLFVTTEFRDYADTLCQLHEVLINKGIVKDLQSSKNYELIRMGVKNSLRRTSESTKQENKPALVFEYVIKETGQTVFKFGYNSADKRIEFFTNEPVKTPSKPDNGKPKGDKPDDGEPKGDKPDDGKPGGDKPDDGKPDDDKPDDGKPDHPTDGNGAKDPNEDPVNKDNAPTGGGKNDDKGPGPKEDKKDTTKPGNTIINDGKDKGTEDKGTTDKTGDVEEKDKNRPVDATDNDTPPDNPPITEGGKDNDDYVDNSGNKTEPDKEAPSDGEVSLDGWD